MSRTHRKHVEPRERSFRAQRSRNRADKRVDKTPKQTRVNDRVRWRREGGLA